MRVLKTSIIVLSLIIIASGCIDSKKIDQRPVEEVIDADTVRVKDAPGTETIRIIGADAPETFGQNQPEFFNLEDTEENRQCLDEKAKEADDYVRELLENETVRLETDPLEGPRDQYDRKLAYVFIDGKTIGEKLMENGYATVFPTDFRYERKYQELEVEAKHHEIGVWSC